MYRTLDFSKIVRTLDTLHKRIEERFPESGLVGVCDELRSVASETEAKLVWINKPHIGLRLFVFVVIATCVALIFYSLSSISLTPTRLTVTDVVTVVEAALNEVILIGAAVFFLLTLEARFKRNKALESMNELRVLAHVIDMHQLTKDPSDLDNLGPRTKSSPARTMTAFELNRYLDYCSEMLSLVAKVAAMYPQALPDAEVINAVNEVESLASSLSREIWQKLMIIQQRELAA